MTHIARKRGEQAKPTNPITAKTIPHKATLSILGPLGSMYQKRFGTKKMKRSKKRKEKEAERREEERHAEE